MTLTSKGRERWTREVGLVCLAVCLVVGQGCAAPALHELVERQDHQRLVSHYNQVAQELRQHAKRWQLLAEAYDTHPEPDARTAAQQAAHCRTIARSYEKAAEAAEALASEHGRQLPAID